MNKTRKLSTDSLLMLFGELEALQKEYDLLHLSKGQTFVSSEFNLLKAKIELDSCQKLTEIGRNQQLLDNTRAKLVAYIHKNKQDLMLELLVEKKNLIENLNQNQRNLNLEFEEIRSEILSLIEVGRSNNKRAPINLLVLRERILYQKQKLHNYIKHFAYLIEFRLDFYAFNNQESLAAASPSESANLIGELDKFPNRFFFSDDILKRVRKSRVKKIRIKKEDVNAELIPLMNHSVLVENRDKNELKVFNSNSKIRYSNRILTGENQSGIAWSQFAFSDKRIFSLTKTGSGLFLLQAFDYQLNRLRVQELRRSIQNPKIKSLNSQVFILENFPQALNCRQKVIYAVYDENLTLESEVEPKFFANEDLATEPILVGATRDILYILVDTVVASAKIEKSVRMIARSSGAEIARLDNYMFEKCDFVFLTDEYEPKLIGLSVMASRVAAASETDAGGNLQSRKREFVNKIYLFAASNGSMLNEANFKLRQFKANIKTEKVWFLPNGYFGFSVAKRSTCYFF